MKTINQMIKKVYELKNTDQLEVVSKDDLKQEAILLMNQVSRKLANTRYQLLNKPEGWDEESYKAKRIILSREYAEYETIFTFIKNFFNITEEEYDGVSSKLGLK